MSHQAPSVLISSCVLNRSILTLLAGKEHTSVGGRVLVRLEKSSKLRPSRLTQVTDTERLPRGAPSSNQ